MQSRGAILGLGIIILIYFFLVQEKIKKKLITIFMIFILPLITWEAITFYKINKFNDSKLSYSKLTLISNPSFVLPSEKLVFK
jgi:hypothetical protein